MYLEWNSHSHELIRSISQLLEQEALWDVTLAAEGKHLKAHRLMLSAASDYFQTILSESGDRLPIIYMKDVPFGQLQCVIEFIYCGKTEVANGQLSDFLDLAHSLGLRGFSERDEPTKMDQENRDPQRHQDGSHSPQRQTSPAQGKSRRRSLFQDTLEQQCQVEPSIPVKHTMSVPANWGEPDAVVVQKKRKKSSSLDFLSPSRSPVSVLSSSYIQDQCRSPQAPLSPLVLPSLWSAAPPSALLTRSSSEESRSSTIQNESTSQADVTLKHSSNQLDDSRVFKKPFTPPPPVNVKHTSTLSCPVTEPQASGSSLAEAPGGGAPPASRASFDSTMPMLDPQELAAKGATLLHHLAVWMIEEKKMKEEQEKEQRSRRLDPMEVNVQRQLVQQGGITRRQSALSAEERPDSGFDSKDESRDETSSAGTNKELSAGSSPEVGEMSRQGLLRQPVLRKRRFTHQSQ